MAISFDGANALITLSTGTTSLGVRDLWSRWVDWWLASDNSKYPLAIANVGGDPIDEAEGTAIPIYAFLLNGWKIKPQEADHTLAVRDGVLLVFGGGDPFLDTLGDYTVRVRYSQPVQAITVSTSGGTAPTTEEIVAAIMGEAIEGAMTLEEALRGMAAVLFGKSNCEGTATITFRDTGDTQDRIVATVDANGNRTDVALDLT